MSFAKTPEGEPVVAYSGPLARVAYTFHQKEHEFVCPLDAEMVFRCILRPTIIHRGNHSYLIKYFHPLHLCEKTHFVRGAKAYEIVCLIAHKYPPNQMIRISMSDYLKLDNRYKNYLRVLKVHHGKPYLVQVRIGRSDQRSDCQTVFLDNYFPFNNVFDPFVSLVAIKEMEEIYELEKSFQNLLF